MKNISSIFQSLGDETRLRILALLLEEDDLCVCYLVEVMGLPQSTVSRNLALLKNAGWLKDRHEGLWNHYSISRSLSPIHSFLLPVLKIYLTTTERAKEDCERLQQVIRENRFAKSGLDTPGKSPKNEFRA